MFVRVSDADPEMLRYLSDRGISPGDRLHVRERQPFGGPLLVSFAGGELGVRDRRPAGPRDARAARPRRPASERADQTSPRPRRLAPAAPVLDPARRRPARHRCSGRGCRAIDGRNGRTRPSHLDLLLAKGRLRATLAMLGPAFVAAIAYVDPGNFATNIPGGAKFGYLLLWVVLVANLMAMLIQYLSAKLGIATDRNLPELCREHFPRAVTWGLWVQAEIMAMSTDIAEFLGAALGLNLLFGVPLLPAGLITGVIAFGDPRAADDAASAASSSRSRRCSGSSSSASSTRR